MPILIEYNDSIEGISAEMLEGFFDGWLDPPSPQTHLQILKNSDFVILAVDRDCSRIIGFINAISDGILCAYIPLLEVLPEYRRRGIGSELTGRMLAKLESLYMVDLLCDSPLQSFYEVRGMSRAVGMMIRGRGL